MTTAVRPNQNPRVLILFPFFLVLYEFCANMSNDMYLPALPTIAEDLQQSVHKVQLTITAWFAGDASVQLLMGPLADRYGRRLLLFSGGALFILSTIGCAVAPSMTILVIARALQGMSVCSMMVAGYASIHDLYDDKSAIHILAWMGSVGAAAAAIGPLFGGVVLLSGSWRLIFYALAALSLVALIPLWFSMPESLGGHRMQLRLGPLTRSYGRIIANRAYLTSALSYGLLYSAMLAWITASPYLLIDRLSLSPLAFGWLQVPIFGALVVAACSVKPLFNRFNKETLIVLGLTIAAISALALLLLPLVLGESALSLVLPMSLLAFGFGLSAAPLNRTTLTATEEPRGSAVAMFYLVMLALGTLASLVVSLIQENSVILGALIAGVVCASFLCNGLRRRCG